MKTNSKYFIQIIFFAYSDLPYTKPNHKYNFCVRIHHTNHTHQIIIVLSLYIKGNIIYLFVCARRNFYKDNAKGSEFCRW